MRSRRVFTDQPLRPGDTVGLDEKSGHYLLRVLRLAAGDPVVLFNGDGVDYAGTLQIPARKAVEIVIGSRLPAAPESKLSITLVQALNRAERMDYTLQKCTELGVAAFQPVRTERVEVRLDGRRLAGRMAHWLSVIRAACEQAGRAVVPELRAPVELHEWLARGGCAARFVLDGKGEAALSGQSVAGDQVELLVGPEGGFTERELKMAVLAGVRAVHLGPRVLRTETAGPAGVAVLQVLGGDL
jgi:16S rRNA (uracil1498-N3)-methyltransferase